MLVWSEAVSKRCDNARTNKPELFACVFFVIRKFARFPPILENSSSWSVPSSALSGRYSCQWYCRGFPCWYGTLQIYLINLICQLQGLAFWKCCHWRHFCPRAASLRTSFKCRKHPHVLSSAPGWVTIKPSLGLDVSLTGDVGIKP